MAFWLTWRFRATTVAGDSENEGRVMTTPKTMRSDELQQQIAQLAREQQREPGEELEEAVRRCAARVTTSPAPRTISVASAISSGVA